MNSETTAATMTMNSEILTAGVLAVTISIPSLFGLTLLVALTTTLIVLVHKKSKNQRAQAEAYYSVVGPPLPPVKTEKKWSYEGNFKPLRIANIKHDIDDNSDHFLTENNSTESDTSIYRQPNVIITTYHNNTATASEVQTEENVAYSHELLDTIENVAYGTNIAIAPEIQVEENVAYSRNLDGTRGLQDSSSPNENITDNMVSN